MPDQNLDVTHFSRYFNIGSPKSIYLAIALVALGFGAGIIASVLAHTESAGFYPTLISGASLGIMTVTIPGILTVIFIKAMKRRMQLRHALFAVLMVSIFYSFVLMGDALLFGFFHNYVLVYVILILVNASIYVYWFLINRVVMNQKRSLIFTAAFEPVVNMLFMIPFIGYLFDHTVALASTLIKLWGGMIVFMAIGYIILYLMDRPAKKELKISGVALITAMINQWMYDITKDVDVFKNGAGEKRNVDVDILVLKGKKAYKAIFVKPEIHYGPMQDIGGSVAPERIGRKLEESFNAAPFIMHGAVSFEDNPISSRQIYDMSSSIANQVSSMNKSSFKKAMGYLSVTSSGPCNAICLAMGDSCLLTLTKAPRVTEDIDKRVGRQLAGVAGRRFENVMLIDAHNSRKESADADELRGIYEGSKYIKNYEMAIRNSTNNGIHRSQLKFGAHAERISKKLPRKDMGTGYTSVGVFDFNGRRFGMLYFDANNALPEFRNELLSHVKDKFGFDAELCTTDTHSVNTIALPASNVLGRETKPEELFPILDGIIAKALTNVEPVEYAYAKTTIKGFRVWGHGTDDALLKVSRQVIKNGKTLVPLILAAGFIIAAWVIYLA